MEDVDLVLQTEITDYPLINDGVLHQAMDNFGVNKVKFKIKKKSEEPAFHRARTVELTPTRVGT